MKKATKNVEKTLSTYEERICEILKKEPNIGMFGMINIYNNLYPEDRLTIDAIAIYRKRLENLGYWPK